MTPRKLLCLLLLLTLLPAAASAMVSPVIHLADTQPYVYLLAAPVDDAQVTGLFFNGVFAAVTGGYTGSYAATNIGASIGFLDADCLELNPVKNPVSAALPVVTVQNPYGIGLNLRVSPNIGTDQGTAYSAGLFENGTQVTVLGVLRDWAYVQVGGVTGYMRRFGLPGLAAYTLPGSEETDAGLYFAQLTKKDTHGYTTTATLCGTARGQYNATVGIAFNGNMLNGILIGYNAYAEDKFIGFLETNGRLNGNADGAPVSFAATLSVPAGTTRLILRQVWSRSGNTQDGEEDGDYNNEFVFGFAN